MHKGKWGIALLLAVGLTACGQDVIEFRNAEIVNGKLYRSGEDVPFTGKATNVPFPKIQTDGTRDFFVAKDKYASYHINGYGGNGRPDLPDYAVTRKLVCEGYFDEGAPSGEFECSEEGSENIALTYEIGGDGDSKIVMYSRQKPGLEIITANFKGHKLNGEFVITSSSTNKVLYSAQYADGRLHGKVEAMNGFTGLLEHKFEHNSETGEVVTEIYFKDGRTIKERVKHQNGQIMEHSVFDENGVETARGERRNGVFDHVPIGQPAAVNNVEDGAESRDLFSDQTQCEEAWLKAHQKEVGEEATVRMDVLEEWSEMCKNGEMPPG